MKLMNRLGLIALFTIVIAGCGDDENTTPTNTVMFGSQDAGPGPMPGTTSCTQSGQCEMGNVCISGTCVPGQCATDVPCPGGMICDAATRRCVDDAQPECMNHRDCANGYCIEGECRNVQCADDSHCQSGMQCLNNVCVAGMRDCVDNDGDGFGVGADCQRTDCDDTDANVHPNILEDDTVRCGDGIDNNCDGIDPVCSSVDGDGDGWTEERGDCDDGDSAVNPGQQEIPYNGRDDDCNSATSDTDVDRDGYEATQVGGNDCDDMNRGINPEARDIPNNGVDEDCDGMDRTPMNADGDGDGFSEANGDCDDEDETINPNAVEISYNGRDDDCDPNTRDNDLDSDGVDHPADCDDMNAARSPDNPEIYYNNVDDDCDPTTSDSDADGDGFAGGPLGDDCNDQNASVNTDAVEIAYNGEDDDCNAATLDDDLDQDGFNNIDDCNDDDNTINPDVLEDASTNCSDGIDHNCRGGDVECEDMVVDADGDGIPDDQDCAPNDENIPGPIEIPNNGLDDDCDENTADVCMDDEFDAIGANSTPDTASPVEANRGWNVQYGGLKLCGVDSDWYSVGVNQGDGIEVDVFFDHLEGDIDVFLYRGMPDGSLQQVDTSLSVTDNETVWDRRAAANGMYYIEVVQFFNRASPAYSMTVNVFEQCTDDEESDPARGYFGEQNDTLEEAIELPEPGAPRRVCSYDRDWYTFELQRAETATIHALFSDDAGDIDMTLYDAEGVAIGRSLSSTDDEEITAELQRGRYYVRVEGFGGSQNEYRIFRTAGEIGTARIEQDENRDVPDAIENGAAGRLEVQLEFGAGQNIPEGAVIKTLIIRDLVINHGFLGDLRVSGQWEGQELVVFWNRQGDNDGRDGGEDDDFLPFTGDDINFDNRRYAEFAGRPAQGTFTLVIEDLANRFDGELRNLHVEVEYFAP